MKQRIRKGGHIVRNYSPYIGDTFSECIRIVENGVAANVSLDGWKMKIADMATGTEFVTLENNSGISFPGDGRVSIELSATQTAQFNPKKRYVYDIQRTKQDGVVKTLQRGIIQPYKDITPP